MPGFRLRKIERRAGPPVEGRMIARWHPETLWCSLKGHAAPAMNIKNVEAKDALIAFPIEGGSHMARCLRCDAWLVADLTRAKNERLAPFNEITVPARGKELRDQIVLKVIAIDRAVHSFVFALIAIAGILIETHLGGLQKTAQTLINNATNSSNGLGQADSQNWVIRELHKVATLNESTIKVILITAIAYCLIEGVEAVGLWRQRRWAEYLTAVATAGFMPLEINEIMDRVTVVRVGALVINAAILIYLLWVKRLFGLNGGGHEDRKLLQLAEVIKPLPGQPIAAPETPAGA